MKTKVKRCVSCGRPNAGIGVYCPDCRPQLPA